MTDGKMKMTDGPTHDSAFLQANSARRAVECFGIWSDDRNAWFYCNGLLIFSAVSIVVANLQLAKIKEAVKKHSAELVQRNLDWRVRSFDEWAESEGLVE